MRFLADMGLDVRVVSWPRAGPNGEIFKKAISERRVILTLDLDFGEIAALARGRKTSVVVFRLHNTRTAHVIQRLSAVLADCSNVLDKGAIVAVEERRHRIRLLPVGEAGST